MRHLAGDLAAPQMGLGVLLELRQHLPTVVHGVAGVIDTRVDLAKSVVALEDALREAEAARQARLRQQLQRLARALLPDLLLEPIDARLLLAVRLDLGGVDAGLRP